MVVDKDKHEELSEDFEDDEELELDDEDDELGIEEDGEGEEGEDADDDEELEEDEEPDAGEEQPPSRERPTKSTAQRGVIKGGSQKSKSVGADKSGKGAKKTGRGRGRPPKVVEGAASSPVAESGTQPTPRERAPRTNWDTARAANGGAAPHAATAAGSGRPGARSTAAEPKQSVVQGVLAQLVSCRELLDNSDNKQLKSAARKLTEGIVWLEAYLAR